MSRSISQTASPSFQQTSGGFIRQIGMFLVDMVRQESAARAIYAENTRIRSESRSWLM